MTEDKDGIIKSLKEELKVRMDCQINQVELIQEKKKQIEELKKKMPKHENESKEEAREKKGTDLDSFTIGTPAKEGGWKVYFNIDEELKKADIKIQDTKAYKLIQLKKAIDKIEPSM